MKVYAKSNKELLVDHIENSLKVFRSFKKAFPQLPNLCEIPEFWRDLFLSVSFHDIGKVANGFQDSLDGAHWNYRHEILSAGFIPNLNLSSPHVEAIALSVITHHRGWKFLSMNYRTWGIGEYVGKKRWSKKVNEMKVHQSCLDDIASNIEKWSIKYLGEKISISPKVLNVKNCQDAMKFCAKTVTRWDSLFPNRMYPIFMRGLTIGCDHLASGQLYSILDGIKETYNKLIKSEELPTLRKFQEKLMKTRSSVFLSASTGTGKTAASLLWCQANQDADRRIFYVLPYVASINAMYRRLKLIFGEKDVGILHHKATYSLYKDFLEQEYGTEESLKLAKEATNVTKKIYRPIKVLTPYQIIKAFFGVKGFETMLSEMADGLFIFDEIHCYESRTVALIVRSAKELVHYGAKFLFMSATLPKFLRKTLVEATDSIPFITLDPYNKIEKKLLHLERHLVLIEESDIFSCINKVKKSLKKGDKVLVVCNTVKRAQELYEKLNTFAKNPRLLHGRFIAKDREKIENEIELADLLVGTQAIEVSLNFDFDIIFTEPAPMDALLQRFGRVNRFGKHKQPASTYVYPQGSIFDKFIYDPSRIKKTLDLLPNGEPLSNLKASELVEELYRGGYSTNEIEEYKQAYDNFDFVIQQLPLFDASEFRNDFFELIGSVEVVPIRFKEDFISMMDKRRFFDAVGYIVPLSKRQFARLKRDGRITSERHQFFVESKYDNSLGLLLDEK